MRRTAGWVIVLCLLGTAGVASGQEIRDLFQFRIGNPGARSLGFGGAFAALADDATAAYVNPAGLVQLVDPEISLEFRFTQFSGPGFSGFDNSTLGFASFVYPRKRWSVAIYEAGLGRSDNLLGLSSILPGPIIGPRASSFLEVTNRGLAGAYRWSETFSIGLGVAQFEGDFNATSQRFFGPGAAGPVEQFLTVTTVEDTDVSLNAGFRWQRPGRWTFGGFFRQGPSFVLDSRRIAVTEDPPGEELLELDPRIPFDLADVFGLGAVFQTVNGNFTASFEWDRVGSAGGLESGDELHVGVEFILVKKKRVLALRLGAWVDPARHSGEISDFPVLFPDGNDRVHVAAGLGFAFKNLKIDIAFDRAERVDTGSLSFVYAF